MCVHTNTNTHNPGLLSDLARFPENWDAIVAGPYLISMLLEDGLQQAPSVPSGESSTEKSQSSAEDRMHARYVFHVSCMYMMKMCVYVYVVPDGEFNTEKLESTATG